MKKLSENLRKIAAALRGMNPVKLVQPATPQKLTQTLGPPGAQTKQNLKGLSNPTATRSAQK